MSLLRQPLNGDIVPSPPNPLHQTILSRLTYGAPLSKPHRKLASPPQTTPEPRNSQQSKVTQSPLRIWGPATSRRSASAHPALTMAPALTISTTMASRPSSPVPPPMSPITPTLPPAQLAGDASAAPALEPLPPATAAQQQQSQPSARPTFAHSQQPDQVGLPPPPPRPIEFDTNPDVIALRSAITVLQFQKNRATADIQTLSQIKNAAIERPDDFVRDLVQGKIGQGAQAQSSSASASAGANSDAGDREPAWIAHSIPKAQDVVRCPPINWSQYAVVGESLDKLHNEQVRRPTQGTPATLGAGGMYQFKGGDGKQEEYPGVAAPYAPLKDKIERKTKSRK